MASRMTQDHNFSVHLDDGGMKTIGSSLQKKKKKVGFGTRKALKNPSALQPSRKHNVIPIGEDLGLLKNIQGRKQSSSITVAEDDNFPFPIEEEGFLHNHDECIKCQNKAMDLDEWLKIVGLDSEEDTCFQPVSAYNPKDEDPFGIELIEDEIFEPIIEYRPRGGQSSPICGSPNSPRMSYDDFPSFLLDDTFDYMLKESV